jgi:hypothetical protein
MVAAGVAGVQEPVVAYLDGAILWMCWMPEGIWNFALLFDLMEGWRVCVGGFGG